MNITQAITLDLAKQTAPVCICAKQGDEKSRMIRITLVRDGEPYAPPSGASAAFRAQKPDGTMVLNSAVVAPDGTVTVELTRQTLAVAGSVTADVYLTDSAGAVLSSASFVIHVEPAPNGVQADSENEFLHLSALVGRAEQAAIRAEGAVQDALHPQRRDNPHGVTAAQVGAATSAALNAHSDDRSNPHGVTAAQAGAAPAGFGLGADSVSVDSWENATQNGFYKSNKGTPDGDGNYWHGIVVNYSGVLCNQLVWKTWGTGSVMATRRINNSIRTEEWEWLDPPMSAGVKYRTTQRYQGKPVYTKLIDCGTLPYNTRKKCELRRNRDHGDPHCRQHQRRRQFPQICWHRQHPQIWIGEHRYTGEMADNHQSVMDRESTSKLRAPPRSGTPNDPAGTFFPRAHTIKEEV